MIVINEQKLVLTLDLPDSVNSIYGTNKFGSFYLKKKGKDYKKNMIKYIKDEVKKQGWVKSSSDEYIYMEEVIFFNRKGRDSDNLKKLQQDCITESEVVWNDDDMCLPNTTRIFVDKYNPRIELVLSIAPFVGVFDDKEHYKKFESKCKGCKRYKNNCSILRELTEGRIHEEVDKNFNCNKFNPIDK